MKPSGALASDPAAGAAVASPRAGRGNRHRGPGGAAVRLLSTLLLIAGLALLADVGAVLVWEEPLSAVIARSHQDALARQVSREERTAPPPTELQALQRLRNDRQRIALLARTLKRTAPHGAGVGRLRIPSLGVSYLLVNGDDTDSLKKGPGIYSQTPFPGEPGTTAVAGHRTTYLAPFRNIDRLRPGQTILIRMPYGDLTYAVEKTRIVDPTDFGVIKPVGHQQLVLSACDPPFSAAKRIIVFARLVTRQPRGPAFPRAAGAAPRGVPKPSLAMLVVVAMGPPLL
ncbi:MAG: sortase, partial [Solirubrobacteraceae bacterium]